MGQPVQLQPQEDLPSFFLLTMLIITSATTAARMAQMIIFARFSVSHVSTLLPSYLCYVCYTPDFAPIFTLDFSVLDSL